MHDDDRFDWLPPSWRAQMRRHEAVSVAAVADPLIMAAVADLSPRGAAAHRAAAERSVDRLAAVRDAATVAWAARHLRAEHRAPTKADEEARRAWAARG